MQAGWLRPHLFQRFRSTTSIFAAKTRVYTTTNMDTALRALEELDGISPEELEKRGYFVHFFRALMSSGVMRFEVGGPNQSILHNAAGLMQKAAAARLTEELEGECHLLQYGDFKGDPTYRIHLAKLLTERYGSPVHSDNILCSAGASQGLNLLATHFLRKGGLVFVEDPTYFLALTMFRDDLELNVIGVPKDDYGIDTGELEKSFKEHLGERLPGDKQPFRCILYLVHCFQNPTGTNTTSERSREIIRLARKYDALVVCDDVYNLLSWMPADAGSGRKYKSPTRLFSYDDPSDPDFKGNVVSNGSVSKFLGPGLRVGWLEAPPRILQLIMTNKYLISGGSFNHVTGGIVGTMLKMGLVGPHLDFACDLLKTTVDAMTEVLHAELPPGVTFHVPQGGYFFWLELPKTIDVDELLNLCREKYKISFSPGKLFTFGTNFRNFLRLSFSFYPKERLTEGCSKLCQAMKEVMAAGGNPPAST